MILAWLLLGGAAVVTVAFLLVVLYLAVLVSLANKY